METFAERFKFARKKAGLNQTELAKKLGWDETGQRRISHWETGKARPKPADMGRVSAILGVGAAWLAFGELKSSEVKKDGQSEAVVISTDVEPWDNETPLENDEVEVPFYTEIEAAAGNGNLVHTENLGPKLRFSKSTLRRVGVQPENVACIKVSGDSMRPAIPDGAVIGVDTGSTYVKDGEIYVFKQGEILRVKQLSRLPTGYKVKSFNSEYETEDVNSEDIDILGWVFWWSVLRNK